MSNTYQCAQCGDTFGKTWSDEEAMAEGAEVFGESLGEDPAVVCDDCYKRIMAAYQAAFSGSGKSSGGVG